MGPRYGAWAPPAYRVNTLSRCDETREFRGRICVARARVRGQESASSQAQECGQIYGVLSPCRIA
jgi:hypothetical protein